MCMHYLYRTYIVINDRYTYINKYRTVIPHQMDLYCLSYGSMSRYKNIVYLQHYISSIVSVIDECRHRIFVWEVSEISKIIVILTHLGCSHI